MSMSRSVSRMTAGFLPAALFLLAACGGGGGGGGGPPASGSTPVVYAGNTDPAVVTTANASKLTANVTGSDNTATTILGVSVESGDATQIQNSGLIDLAQRLNRNVRDTVVLAGQANSAQRPVTAVIQVEQTDPCQSGSVRTFGTLNDNGTGTLQVSFNNCLIDMVTLSGSATLRVDAAIVTLNVSPTDSTLSFSRLTLRGPGLSIDAGGSLRALLSTAPFGTETLTVSLVSLDNNTGKMTKTENLVFVNVSSPSITTTVTGRVFDQDHGYVDITTPTPFVFGTPIQLFPNSGQMLLTGAPMGAGNLRIRATAFSATLVDLELDLTGGGFPVGKFARLKWTDLSGPVGADLGDTDGDGMHNSWETVNGLNPGLDDAAGNKDGDAFTNLQEYLAGTAP